MATNRRQPLAGKSLNTSSNASPQVSKSQAAHGRRLVQASGSLEIIDGKDGALSSATSSPGNSRPPSETSNRSWSCASVGSIPPRSDSSLGRRTLTPTKQVSLQAVRRKEESDEPFVEDVDWRTLKGGTRNAWDREGSVDDLSDRFSRAGLPRSSSNMSDTEFSEQETLMNGHASSVKELIEEEKEVDEKENAESSNDDDVDSESEEIRKAPNELLMEFVDCVIKKDFKNADKLCTMILLYEPANPEALKFKPLIQEKMRLDEEAANEEDSEDEDDNDDEDDDSDDDDSSEEDSSEEDDDDDDEEGAVGVSGSGSSHQAPGPSASSSGTRDIFDLTAPSDGRWEHTLRDNKPSGSKS